jgi:hypothetical protein
MKRLFRSTLIVLAMSMFAGLCVAASSNSASFALLGPSGGLGGTYFADNQNAKFRIVQVRVRSAEYVNSIQLVYENGSRQMVGAQHGGNGGKLEVFKLEPGEYITAVSGKYGLYVESMTIETSKGHKKSWGGSGGITSYTYQAPKGSSIHGFFGRASESVDAIGVIVKTP